MGWGAVPALGGSGLCLGAGRLSVQLVRSPPSAFPRDKRDQPHGHRAQGQPGGQSFRIGPRGAPALPSVSCLLCSRPRGVGGTGEDRGGWGGSAYRGGAGGENVITRSSLLKVRHRLVGTEFMGGGGHSEPGLGWGQEATPECPTEQHQEPLAPGTGGHRQTQH